MSMEKYEEKNYKVYRFCDGEIVDGLNRKHYNPQKEDDMQCICTILNAQIHELNKLQKENKKLQGKYDKQLWIYNGLGCEYDCLKKENERLKQEVTHWKKILDNHQQMIAKTLREQYHWLKNEDKIQNNDKTVALLELESISARLGIDLN